MLLSLLFGRSLLVFAIREYQFLSEINMVVVDLHKIVVTLSSVPNCR